MAWACFCFRWAFSLVSTALFFLFQVFFFVVHYHIFLVLHFLF